MRMRRYDYQFRDREELISGGTNEFPELSLSELYQRPEPNRCTKRFFPVT